MSVFVVVVVTGTFSNTMKFIVKDCDPNTGEADEEGYNDEYVVCLRPFCLAGIVQINKDDP